MDYPRARSARRDCHLCNSGNALAGALRNCTRAGRSAAEPASRTARRGTEPGPHLVPLPAAAGLFLGLADLLAGVSGESAPDLAVVFRPGALPHRGSGGRAATPACCLPAPRTFARIG